MKRDYIIDEIRGLMEKALKIRGFDDENTEFIVNDYLTAEIEGHRTHGISKFLMIGDRCNKESVSPDVKSINNNIFQINGNGCLGHIAAREAATMCSEAASLYGMAMCSITNISRYSRLFPYAEIIAKSGNIGIVMNNGGPACVAPFGASQPLLGSNPICFGFPGVKDNYIFDMSTSKSVWGMVRQAIVDGTMLPEESFLDENGCFTQDPFLAKATLPFGDFKGYSLCYAIELLTGAFVGARMGKDSKDEYDLGYLIIAFSPGVFTSSDSFYENADDFAANIRTMMPGGVVNESGRVYVPGDRAKERLNRNLERGIISLDDDIYCKLKLFSSEICNVFDDDYRMN